MADHLSAQLIEGYRQHALEPTEMLAADVHLATCAACRQTWRAALALPSPAHLQAKVLAAQISEAEVHLAAEQVRAFVAGQLDAVDHELAESHLEVCAACQTQIAAARVTPQATKTPWWHTILPTWLGNLGEVSLTWPLVGTAVLLASLAWGVMSWRQTVQRQAEFAAASPTPTAINKLPLPTQSPEPALPLLALNDGGRQVTLDAQGALTGFELLTEAERQTIQAALTSGRVETPRSLAGLRSRADALMGLPHYSIQVLTPESPGKRTETLPDSTATKEPGKSTRPASAKPGKTPNKSTVPIKVPAQLKPAPAPEKLSESEIQKSNSYAQAWAENSTDTLLKPVSKILAERRPTLRWKALPGATSYVVTINEPAANFREAAVSPALTKPQWTVPTALPRGRLFTWQVTATINGREVTAPAPSAPEAKFRVLTAAQAAELAQGRQTYAGQHLPLGLLYARLGLLAEAEREFQALAQANPTASVVQKLLREVRAKQAGLRR